VLRPETVAILTLLFAAVFLSPWLLLRHYRALTQASIEHEQSAYLATHDVLTGVPNRYLLADHFKLAVHNWERNGARFAVLLLDLDHFKDINDRFGHEAGDRVLCAAADRMTAQLRSCDTVARYGGDEFIILLTNILDAQDAVQVGDKLLAAVSHPIATPGGSLTVSCSLGIAVCPDHGTDLDTLRRNADMAMYQAKQSGRGAVVVSAAQQG
jgi:diguanylate cyclase (GGDEF)-like protein